ncbi:MAG: hypothetical protein OHK0044_25490 [Burkholderiaceae bacterium]
MRTPQEIAWILSLGLMAAVAAAFAWVALRADVASGGEHAARAYRWRAWLFWLVVGAGVVLAFGTLTPWPIEGHARTAIRPDVTVRAVAHQFRWEIEPPTVPVGKLVEFEVTAADVNHGFAVYRNGRLLAQAQAMPGFTNRLRMRFEEPGDYDVLCLEYCGVAHHGMRAVIKAVPSS